MSRETRQRISRPLFLVGMILLGIGIATGNVPLIITASVSVIGSAISSFS